MILELNCYIAYIVLDGEHRAVYERFFLPDIKGI